MKIHNHGNDYALGFKFQKKEKDVTSTVESVTGEAGAKAAEEPAEKKEESLGVQQKGQKEVSQRKSKKEKAGSGESKEEKQATD